MPREKKTHVGAQVNYGKCKIPITVSPVSPGKCLRKERATRAESESEIWGEREIEEEKETEDRGREEDDFLFLFVSTEPAQWLSHKPTARVGFIGL